MRSPVGNGRPEKKPIKYVFHLKDGKTKIHKEYVKGTKQSQYNMYYLKSTSLTMKN